MNPAQIRNIFAGYGEIIAAAILWGLAGIFGKMIIGMSAQSIIFYRVTIAFIILFAVLLISGNLYRVHLKNKKSYLVMFSILQAATMLTYFEAILNASVSIAVLLLYTAPVYVTVLSPLLLKERATKKGLIALLLSIAGILFIVGPEKPDFSLQSIGIIAGILSGIAYGFQIMTSKFISSTYSGYTQAFWSFLVAALVLLPSGLVPMDVFSSNVIFLILLAIFPTILAVSLYFNGLAKVRAASASILGLIEPVSAIVLSVLILNERLAFPEVIGGAFILAGAALVATDR
ncbi:MAG: DMT family transporter [Candidatus Methanoperedens sp.]|nr:DMT family transporter [Candidatus Methanoperedens sp.]MCZ7369192.1 DMT family transporter [Candidatus Methanoperedens sp.]